MRITQVTLYAAPIELREPFVISLGPFTHANNVFVRVDTEDDHQGWGEASPFPSIHGETMQSDMVIGQFLAQQLLGADPANHPRITSLMDRAIYGNSCIKSALDMACYDLAARAEGIPLWKYLGANTSRSIATDYTVSLGPISQMAEKAAKVKSQGFPVIKVKLGDGLTDLERLNAIRQAVGPDIPLRLDANQGWSVPEAMEILPQLDRFNIQHCEEPIDKRNYLELAKVRAVSTVPIMADESCCDHEDAARLINLQAIDRVNIKLSKAGGLYKSRKIVELTRNHGLLIQIGGFLETRLGFTAAAHLGMLEGVAYYDFDTPLMQLTDPIIGGLRYGPAGRIDISDTPGLGARVDPDFLKGRQRIVVD